MKEIKKQKIKNLEFYIVDDNYIEFLRSFETKVAYNKKQKRPYIGIVIKIKDIEYFVPLFSPKEKHKTYQNNLSIFKIKDKMNNHLGIIKFSKMIPVPKNSISLLDLKNCNYNYRRLILKQYDFINKTKNKEKILEKAEKLYKLVISKKENKVNIFYKNLSCNFRFLEEKCKEYIKNED